MINFTLERKPSAETMRTLRKAQGLSLKTVSERTGFTQSTISRWERGERTPSVENYERVIKTLGYHLTAMRVK